MTRCPKFVQSQADAQRTATWKRRTFCRQGGRMEPSRDVVEQWQRRFADRRQNAENIVPTTPAADQ